MIVILRVRTGEKDIDVVWNYIIEHQKELQNVMDDNGILVYVTKRARMEDTSIFICTDDLDVVENFIAEKIAPMDFAEDVWMLNLSDPTFLPIPSETPKEMQRFTITVRAHPKHFKDIKEKIVGIKPTSEYVVNYVTYTYQLFFDSVLVSLLAKDEETAGGFAMNYIRGYPGVTGTKLYLIKKTQRLVTPEKWKEYTAHHSIPTGWEQMPILDVADI
jgi:hypothetical protein